MYPSAPKLFVLRRTLFSIALCVFAASAFASTRVDGASERLLYAGFAFAADRQNREALYPYSAALANEQSGAYLDTMLRLKLIQRPASMQRVSLEPSDDKSDVSSVAFALVQESTETQQIDGKYWAIVTLQANVLAFNKATKSLVASYPVRMRISEVQSELPIPQDFAAMIRHAYTSSVPSENIFDIWLTRFESISIRNGARKYLRVTDITVLPEAEKVILKYGQSVSATRNQLANLLEAAVAESTGVPLVPNSVGEAIGSKMAYQFSDGDAFELNLPDADFTLSFVIRDFVSSEVEKPEYCQDIYRAKGTIVLKQPLTARVILNEDIYNTLIVTRPREANVKLTDWDQYYKTLQALIFSVSKELIGVDNAWLKENASRELAAKSGFLQSRQLLSELR